MVKNIRGPRPEILKRGDIVKPEVPARTPPNYLNTIIKTV